MAAWLFKFVILPGLCLTIGFAAGWKAHDWRDAAAQVKAVQHVVGVVGAQGDVNQAVAVRQQAAQDHVQVVTRTLVQKAPFYVTTQADHRCVVPDGFVRLHDAAAAGVDVSAIPDGAGQSVDAPSGVALDTVAATVVGNYGICAGFREQLIGWQAWYAGQQAAFAHPPSGEPR